MPNPNRSKAMRGNKNANKGTGALRVGYLVPEVPTNPIMAQVALESALLQRMKRNSPAAKSQRMQGKTPMKPGGRVTYKGK